MGEDFDHIFVHDGVLDGTKSVYESKAARSVCCNCRVSVSLSSNVLYSRSKRPAHTSVLHGLQLPILPCLQGTEFLGLVKLTDQQILCSSGCIPREYMTHEFYERRR